MPIPPPPRKVFCPTDPIAADDLKVRNACISAKNYLPGVSGPLITGRTGGLGVVDHLSNLYIICHGHPHLALFTVGTETWTPIGMANLLETSGLKQDHRQIVMLVCHGGQSLGDKKVIDDRMRLRGKINQEKSAGVNGSAKKIEKLTAQYEAEVKGSEPEAFTSAAQTLPMVCQLMVELKARKYTSIRLRAYLGEVSTSFLEGIQVKVQGKYVPASPQNTVDWL